MKATIPAGVPTGIALYMAVVQFLFVTTWTVYVIFLPRLLESSGLPASLAPMILLIDQLVFLVMDIYVGVAADRAQRTLGRLAPLIIGMTTLSCLAFLLLPHASLLGAAAPAAALALTLIWTATSSALRAPPWVLLGKYAATPSVPRLNTLMLCGLAAGGAIAPYLGVTLKNIDPRWPFALSSLTLLAATWGIVYVERQLKLLPPPSSMPAQPAASMGKSASYLAGLLLLALGFQVLYSINTMPQFARLASAASLEWLTPVFWIGFAIAMMAGSALCKRHGALRVMIAAALLGACAAALAAVAATLPVLITAQVCAGFAWGTMLTCAYTIAMVTGRADQPGREGFVLGLMFAVLAAATLMRIATVMSGASKDAAIAEFLSWLPALLWFAGALLLMTRR